MCNYAENYINITMKNSKTDGSTTTNSIAKPSKELAWRLQRITSCKRKIHLHT